MGHGADGGYRSSPSSFRVLRTNIDRLAGKYPLDRDRWFGKRVSERISEIRTDDPVATAKEFWKALSRGGVVQEIKTKYGTGRIAIFDDKCMSILAQPHSLVCSRIWSDSDTCCGNRSVTGAKAVPAPPTR